MRKIPFILPRWIPALLMMLVIFSFSAQPGDELPDFLNWDYVVKKTAHMIGYGLLALCNFHALRYDRKYYRLAWLLAVLYAATDEFHQSFVPGRSATLVDVMAFDNIGAIIALWLFSRHQTKNSVKS